MTISQIRNTLLRRTLVILTLAAEVAIMLPVWAARYARDEFGEDLTKAWEGE